MNLFAIRSFRFASLAFVLASAACTASSEGESVEDHLANDTELVDVCPSGTFVKHEASPTNEWFKAGTAPEAYSMDLVPHAGQPGVRISSRGVDQPVERFGTYMHTISAAPFRGKKLRFSASASAKDVTGWGGLWMRVDAGKTPIAFDNMQDRPFVGDLPQNKHEVILDVAPSATTISYGVLLAGSGSVTLLDASLQIVEPAGQPYEQDPAGWFVAGKETQDYAFSNDANGHCGRSSAGIASRVEAPAGFATLMQDVAADKYRGRRVRLSGFVSAQTSGQAALWMRVDDAAKRDIASDFMQGRPITTTNGWQPYSIVLDVPADAVNIAFGLKLEGKGNAWVNSARLEILDESHTGG